MGIRELGIKKKIDMKHEQVILGQIPSKSNCYKIITIAGHSSLGKTAALRAYEKSFFLQCGAYRDRKITDFFRLDVDVYFSSNLPDLDNSLKGLLDCLQMVRAIKNDRQCTEIHARKFIDKNNPRIEFTITEVNGVEKRDSRFPSLFDE